METGFASLQRLHVNPIMVAMFHLSEAYEVSSILFVEVANIDILTRTLKPADLVEILTTLSTIFEDLVTKHGLHKVFEIFSTISFK